MPFPLVAIIISAAIFVLGELLRPKPQIENAKAKGIDELNFPTATEARPIPVAWGTVLQKAPNLIWYGDYRAVAIVKKIKTSLFTSKKVTQGYKYHVGMAFALSFGKLDAFEQIQLNEREAWAGSTQTGTIDINKPEFNGGEQQGGGYVATIDLYDGRDNQAVNAYLAAQCGGDSPAYNNVSLAVWRGPSAGFSGLDLARLMAPWWNRSAQAPSLSGYIGTSGNLDPIAFRIRRCPANLNPAWANINGDSNPAEALFELLTDGMWGMGAAASLADMQSFLYAAQRLHAEGMGWSYLWDQAKTIEEMGLEILQQIDGVLYSDLRTGEYVLKLARDDYDVDDLPLFDESNIIELTSYSQTTFDETTNEVRINYRDRSVNFEERPAYVQDLANFQTQGANVAVTLAMPGISNGGLAVRVADRELRVRSLPLPKAVMKLNRQGHSLVPGSTFRWSWAEHGIDRMVMRVASVRPGELLSGAIEVTCVQDVFSLGETAFTPPQPTGWVNPVTDAIPVTQAVAKEQPYHFARDGANRAWSYAAQPNGSQLDYDLLSSSDGGATYPVADDVVDFAPTGTLVDAYPADTADIDATETLIIAPGAGMERLEPAAVEDIVQHGANLFGIGDEVMAFEGYEIMEDGRVKLLNVWRGLLDTVPAEHAAGARVWFFSYGQALPETSFPDAAALRLRHLTHSSRGTLDLGDAPDYFLNITGRAARPYVPGDLQVNGETWLSELEGGADVDITWAHRDRLAQTEIVRQSAEDIGPEAGVTYTVRVYGDGNLLKHTEAGIVDAGWSYTQVAERADNGGDLNNTLRIEVESVRDGLVSYQKHVRNVIRVGGYGSGYGLNYGG